VGGQHHPPATLPPGKRPGTYCTEGWVGPKAGRDGCGKSRPPPGFDPQTVQPLASCYTDYAIPARNYGPYCLKLAQTIRFIFQKVEFGLRGFSKFEFRLVESFWYEYIVGRIRLWKFRRDAS